MRREESGKCPSGLRGMNRYIWFWLGMAVMVLTVVPNLILGEQSIFTSHDQLDGEMIAYILQAKHLFSGGTLPEFMGGMPKTALTPPAPVCVLLFLRGDYFAALLTMQLAGRIVGFAGMYLLAREAGSAPWTAAAAGALYGLLPFLPVYGLSQYGIPMLFWCVTRLRSGRRLVASYCYVAFYGLASSLVLVGFGLLGMGFVVLLGDFVRKKAPWHFLAAWQLLLFTYIAENFRLLCDLAGPGGDSHKAEYVLGEMPFWGTLLRNLSSGGQHSEGYQKLLVPVTLVLAVGMVFLAGAGRGNLPAGVKGPLKCMGICLGWNIFFASASALWVCTVGVAFRSRMDAMRAFQLDRLLWIAPCLWYLLAACGYTVLERLWKCRRGIGRIAAGGCMAVTAAAAGITGIWILLSGDVKSNMGKLRDPEYSLLSFSDYYAVGVMEQVRDFLAEYGGAAQEDYRVVSLGIDPSAALYHGFYCLDGYSNNYSAAYKHEFRKVIAPELERSEYLRAYFDDWGNRCYMFSSECPGYYTIEKGRFFFRDYRLDAEALREMGCRYLLSAAYIQNAADQGLKLLNEEPFETQDSYYGIYVYEVM